MTQTVRDLMTPDPVAVDESASLRQVAKLMRERDIGDVIVERQGAVGGIVTDRDIVVRAIAEGEDPDAVVAGDICSGELVSLSPTDTLEDAARVMADAAVRRLPVVDTGRAVGIVTLGDLARVQEPDSALADISAEPPSD